MIMLCLSKPNEKILDSIGQYFVGNPRKIQQCNPLSEQIFIRGGWGQCDSGSGCVVMSVIVVLADYVFFLQFFSKYSKNRIIETACNIECAMSNEVISKIELLK